MSANPLFGRRLFAAYTIYALALFQLVQMSILGTWAGALLLVLPALSMLVFGSIRRSPDSNTELQDQATFATPTLTKLTVDDFTDSLHKDNRIFRGLSTATNCLIAGESFGHGVEQALGEMVDALQVECAYVCRHLPEYGSSEPVSRCRFGRHATTDGDPAPSPSSTQIIRAYPKRWLDAFSDDQVITGSTSELPAVEQTHLTNKACNPLP